MNVYLKSKLKINLILAILFYLVSTSNVWAKVYSSPDSDYVEPEVSVSETPFYQGRIQFGLSGGSSQYGDQSIFSIGMNGAYFIIDHLALELGYQASFGDDLSIYQPSTGISYYLNFNQAWYPYFGGVYEHMRVNLDKDSFQRDWVGGKAGVLFQVAGSIWVGVGGRVLRELGCTGSNCVITQPDFQFSIAF